jgi:pantothenate kinase type III
MKIDIDHPAELGNDRIAESVAVKAYTELRLA